MKMRRGQFAIELLIILSLVILAFPAFTAFQQSISDSASSSLAAKQQQFLVSEIASGIDKACFDGIKSSMQLPCAVNSLSQASSQFKLSILPAPANGFQLQLLNPSFQGFTPTLQKQTSCALTISDIQLSCQSVLCIQNVNGKVSIVNGAC